MPESRFYHITPAGKLIRVPTLQDALAASKEGGTLWLDFQDPSREDLAALVTPLGIHPLSLEDCLDQDQVPKVEDFPGHTFMLLNTYSFLEQRLVIEEVDFLLGPDFLVTVHGHDSRDLAFFSRLEQAVAANLENARQGPDFLLHLIMDYVVDNKFGAIEALQEQIDDAEERILKDLNSFRPEALLHRRRELLSLRKSLFHEREVLLKVCRRDSRFIGEKAVYHFRDIYDHLAKFFEVAEIAREMITNLMEMYLSMINNQMAKVSNRINRTVRRLTVLNTIFMPITLIASIGGMSEWSMMTGPENWKISYPLFILGLVVVAVANYFLLKWFEARVGKSHRQPVLGAPGKDN